jgi:hypothetical protein
MSSFELSLDSPLKRKHAEWRTRLLRSLEEESKKADAADSAGINRGLLSALNPFAAFEASGRSSEASVRYCALQS